MWTMAENRSNYVMRQLVVSCSDIDFSDILNGSNKPKDGVTFLSVEGPSK